MNAGKLDTKIHIESPVTAPDENGDPVTTWTPLSSPNAEMRNMAGRELSDAMQRVAETDTKFIVRYLGPTKQTNAKCRITVPKFSTVYDVLEALPMPGGRPERLEILAKRRAD